MTESLSVNRYSLSPADKGSSERQQRPVAAFGLFEADQQFAEPIEPGVCSFNHPSARLVAWVLLFLVPFLTTGLHVQLVAVDAAGRKSRETDIGGIGAESLDLPAAGIRPGIDDSLQRRAQQNAVMLVGSAGDERQRDATRVHQEAAFASIFSPDP